jgi:hypothetical protein
MVGEGCWRVWGGLAAKPSINVSAGQPLFLSSIWRVGGLYLLNRRKKYVHIIYRKYGGNREANPPPSRSDTKNRV